MLNVYAAESHAFDDEECVLLEELARDVAYGVNALRTRKHAEREQRKFQHLADNLPELIYRADAKTFEPTYVNQAIEKIYGYTPSEWLNKPTLWERSIHPDDRDRVLAEFEIIEQEAGAQFAPRVVDATLAYRDELARRV